MTGFVGGKISCIMATSGRAAMAARSCELFAQQTYKDRELIIVADRGELERDPAWDENIILLEVPPKTPTGTRRNLACHHATGEWLVQWDDDDWRGNRCLDALVAPLRNGRAEIAGFKETPFFEVESGNYWLPRVMLEKLFPHGVHPGTLAFHRDIWEKDRYPATTMGEDLGLLGFAMHHGARLEAVDPALGEHFICVRHGDNTWKLKCGETHGVDTWKTIPTDQIPETANRWLSEWNSRIDPSRLDMVGVTIASPLVREMAEEAADRFTWATGLPAYIRIQPDDHCYRSKFDLARDFGGTVVYFDSDLWFLRKTDLSRYFDQECFLAALDPGRFEPGHFPLYDSQVMGLDPTVYFNSALMIWNQRHLPMWELARKIGEAGKYPNLNDPHIPTEGGQRLRDFGEQSYINAAVQQLGTPFEPLPDSLNYMPFAARVMKDYPRLRNPVACHAAGYGIEQKRGFLEFCVKQWSVKK